MEMLDIFDEELKALPFELKLLNVKRGNVKSKLTIGFGNQQAVVELSNNCAPRAERDCCWRAIATAMSDIYLQVGNIQKAKLWMRALGDRSVITSENY